jgi:hypothetical protein
MSIILNGDRMIPRIIKRIIFAFCIIYGFNLILRGFNIVVPINYYSLGIVSLLGFPGLIMLALSFMFLI